MSTEEKQQHFLRAYDTYADAIFRFCYAQAGDREIAKDATQEAFVRTWKYLAQGKEIEQLRPFLYRTARNVLIDRHRRERGESLEALTESGFDLADDHAPDPFVASQVAQAVRMVGRLESPYREAVTLRYIEELPPREIAQITGESQNTISVRIHRGLEQLKKLMGIHHD